MSKASECLRKILAEAFRSGKTTKASFKRATGFSSSQIEDYINGTAVPKVNQLDRIGTGLGLQPWELIKPETSLPTSAPVSPTVESLLKTIADQEERLKQIEGIPPEVLATLKKCTPNKMQQILIVLGLKDVLTAEDRAPIKKKSSKVS